VDKIVISNLRKDSRKNVTKISRRYGIPVTTLYDRMNHTQKRFVIKNTSLLNYPELGFPVVCHVAFVPNKASKHELLPFLMEHKNINSLYKVDFGTSLIAETVFRDITSLEIFLEQLERDYSASEIKTTHITQALKKEDFLNNVEHFD